jgi:pSer/pThr/pTyr-binding forkhead associated (FHA) protein
MKTTLRGIYALLLLMAGGVVQAQQQPSDTLFETFGIGIVFAVVGLMVLTLGVFIRQLWQQAKQSKVEALTDRVQPVSAISPATNPNREGHGTALYIPVPPELQDAPTMLLELVTAPSGGRLQAGQQWFINQNRTPFVIGAGTDENQALDILLPNNFVSSFHLKIEFEALKQRFVVIDTDSLNGTSFNDAKMQANTRYPIPADKPAMVEVAHQYVFKVQQVKGKPVIEPHEELKVTALSQGAAQANSLLPLLNLGEVGVTEAVEPIRDQQGDFIATSKLPDVSELMDSLPEYAVTAEVATLADAPDMSNIVGVRYPLHNVEYPPLARLPADIDAMIEVLKSPQAEPATYTIWRTVYHVGRGDKTDLRLPGAMISNNHFSIYWTRDSFWVIDTSLNQTWLRWADTENILERGIPVKLEIGRDYQLILAREDTMLRFRYVKSEVNSDSSEITLPPLPVSIRPTLTMVRIGTTDERKEFSVNSNRITIGRESTNVVQLDPQVISRRHAELVWKSDAYYLQDKGSLYGVMVDDTPLQSGGEKRLDVGKKHRIVLSPKQRDAVHLEFLYVDKRSD